MKTIPLHYHYLTTVPSTNTWALEHADTLSHRKLTIVYTYNQTAGRGRGRRTWHAPAGGNITASFCFVIPKLRNDMGNIAQVMALSAHKLVNMLGVTSQIHWPNDLYINGKKAAGILTETTPRSDGVLVVVGIGLNINMPREELEEIDRPATSLFEAMNKEHDPQDLLEALAEIFVIDLSCFLEQGFEPFFEMYQKNMILQEGKEVQINDFKQIWKGGFDSLNPDGSLEIVLENGEKKTVSSGEIL